MKPIFHLEHMIDHQKQVLLLLQCCTGMWDLWQLQCILFHQTRKFAGSLHQHHHTELEEKVTDKNDIPEFLRKKFAIIEQFYENDEKSIF